MFPRGNSKRMRWVLLASMVFLFLIPLTSNPINQAIELRFPIIDFGPAGIGDNTEDFVDATSNLHLATPDKGTHSVFGDLQDYGANYDQMQEADYGGAGGSEWLDTNSHLGGYSSGGWTLTGTTPYLDIQDEPTNIISTKIDGAYEGYWDFDSTSLTGSGISVNFSAYGMHDDGPTGEMTYLWWGHNGTYYTSGNLGFDNTYGYKTYVIPSETFTATEVNAMQYYIEYDKSAGADESYVDYVRMGTTQTGATNYELDLEVGWSSADYDETNEELCIYPVTGGGWPSEDIKVDIWTGTWTNVFTDLTPDTWNNQSVSLTGNNIEVRFLGGTESGDTTQDTWEIDAVLLHTWTTSYTPANDQAPSFDNPSDIDNMYAQYLEYQITVYVSDQNGFADIDYLEIGLWDNTETTEYWRFRYDEDTDTFTEEYDSGTVVSLNTGGSSATESGDDIDATFYFTVDWDHPDISETDAKCYVIDTQTDEDTDWYEVNWDVETRLDYSVAPAVTSDDAGTVDIGDLDETFYLGGTIIYYTSVDDYPPSAQVDVWVSATKYGSTPGPWSDLTLASGVFSVTCYADDAVGTDTCTVKPVIEGAGSGGTTLYYTTDLTDTYTATQVQVQSYSSDDGRININTAASDHVTLYYAHDSSYVTTGTVTVNGVSASYSGSNGIWDFGETKATVQQVIYDTVTISGDTHGITGEDQNGQSLNQIWDQIVVVSYTIVTPTGDDRVDIGTTVTIDAELHYDYDETDVVDGTVTVNSLSTTYQSAGKWRFSDSEATVMANTYNDVQATGNIEGITVEDNTITQQIIWDSIQVQSYSRSDDHDNINDDVTVDVTLWYDYDDTLITDGTVTINTISAAHQGSGVWRITENEATVQLKTYDTVACSGNTHGITAVDQNGQSTTVIWDRIQVQTTVVDDGRLNINDNAEIRVTLWLDYDDTYLGSGDSVTLNDVSMSWDAGNSWFDLARTQASVGLWNYYVNSSSEATYGITALDLNSQDIDVIFDRLVIDMQADDETPDNGIEVTFTLTIIFDYDDTTCTTYQIAVSRDLVWWHSFTNVNKTDFKDTNTDVSYDYTTKQVTSESTYGITSFTSNTETVTWSGGMNQIPVNDTIPNLIDPHDTDHMYAWIQYYTLTSNVSDADGYTDIVYVELSLYDNAQAGEVWRIRYTVIGQVFSVEFGGAYINLSGSSVDESGNDIDITWVLRIDWDHDDLSDIDTKQYVVDDEPESDTDWYESNWEIETRLDILSLAISESRGKTSRNDLSIIGKVIYFESASELTPTTALVDVWADGPVSDKVDYDLSSGDFSITAIESSATVKLDVHIIRVVIDAEGVGGTELTHQLHTKTYISDMLKVTLSTSTPHVDLGVEVTIDVEVVYAYDESAVSSYFADILRNVIDFVTINETDPSFTDMELVDTTHVYTISSANETLYGIELVSWSNSLTVIWGVEDDTGQDSPRTTNITTTNNPSPYEQPNYIWLGIGLGTMFVIFWMTREENPIWRRN